MTYFKRFTKGILITLMFAMMLNVGTAFIGAQSAGLSIPEVHAQGGEEAPKSYEDKKSSIAPSQGPESGRTTDELVAEVSKLANKSHRLFAPLINFLAFKIGDFLGTDYVYEGAMGQMLQKIWVIMRNIVNIAFVFILLLIALKEIFLINQESQLKQSMVKFVLLLVAVNFSWLGAKIVLDASNVLTYVTFAIPSGIADPPAIDESQCQINDPEQPLTGLCYPTAIIAPVDAGTSSPLYWESGDECDKVIADYGGDEGADGQAAYTADGNINNEASEENKRLQKRVSMCVERLNLLSYDQNTATIYLTYGMARIQNLVNPVTKGSIDQKAVAILLSLLIQIAYTVALGALFFALIIRMAFIWIFVAFSPLLILMLYFSGEGRDPFGTIRDKFSLEAFGKWAFVPAKVGAVFAVTFIMVSAGQAVTSVNFKFFDNLASSKTGIVTKMPEVQSLFGSIGSLQNFIWLLVTLAILWLGTFAVLQDMPVVSSVTERIKGAGNSFAKFLGTSPYWAPVVPLGRGGEKTSVKEQLSQVAAPLQPLLDRYRGSTFGSQDDDARRLQQRAPKVDLSKLVVKAQGGTFNHADANRVAKDYGYRNVEHLLETDRRVLLTAFQKSGAKDEVQATKLYDAIKRMSKPKSAAEKSREASEQAKATQKGVEAAQAKAGPQPPAPGGANPPTAPKPPTQ